MFQQKRIGVVFCTIMSILSRTALRQMLLSASLDRVNQHCLCRNAGRSPYARSEALDTKALCVSNMERVPGAPREAESKEVSPSQCSNNGLKARLCILDTPYPSGYSTQGYHMETTSNACGRMIMHPAQLTAWILVE